MCQPGQIFSIFLFFSPMLLSLLSAFSSSSLPIRSFHSPLRKALESQYGDWSTSLSPVLH